MARRRRTFVFPLDGEGAIFLRSRLDTDGHRVLGFAVQLEIEEQGKRNPALRFDTAHGYVHVHTFGADGSEERNRLEFPSWEDAYTSSATGKRMRRGSARGSAKPTMVEKNLDLHYHLMMQLLRDPGSLDIPQDAEVILLPEDDPALRKANLRAGRKREGSGAHVVYVSVRLVPETRTVLTPQLAVVTPEA